MPLHTRSFFFPALGIGVFLSIAFFKIYGPLTRPSVPKPVSSAISSFAPGVEIGKAVKDVKGLRAPYWVQHVGYVSDVGRPELLQVRYLMPADLRALDRGDPRTPIDAVEIVGPPSAFMHTTQIAILTTRFMAPVRVGCLIPGDPGLPKREVVYWTTKNDRGGLAVINDFYVTDAEADRAARDAERARIAREYELARIARSGEEGLPKLAPVPKRFELASIVFWNGPFEGARTLRGNFVPRLCAEIEDRPAPPPELRGEIAANDSLLVQLGYRPAAAATP